MNRLEFTVWKPNKREVSMPVVEMVYIPQLPILVFAESHNRARVWAAENNIRSRDYVYVENIEYIRGRQNNPYIRLDRRDVQWVTTAPYLESHNCREYDTEGMKQIYKKICNRTTMEEDEYWEDIIPRYDYSPEGTEIEDIGREIEDVMGRFDNE